MAIDNISRGLAIRNATAKSISTILSSMGEVTGKNYLRETHMRLRKLALGEATQLVIAVFGDSYVAGDFWSAAFAKTLQDKFGLAGVGWVGFGFYGTDTTGTYVTGGTQPGFGGTSSVDGNIRPDLVAKPTFDGTWTSSYGPPGANVPSCAYAQSAVAGDRVSFSFPAGHNAARVFYNGDVAGSFRYSWDGGSTWAGTISYSVNSGGLSSALSAIPNNAGTLIFEVVSGSARIAGVDMQSSASGVRVHKLGGSGTATATWSIAGANSGWKIRIAELGANLIIAGWQTNDQGTPITPAVYGTQLATIINGLRTPSFPTVFPYADILLTSPPENQRTTNAYPMSQYSAVTRDYAFANRCAYLDHQFNFGEVPSDYAATNTQRPWYNTDKVHPATATGGRAICDAVLRAIGVL